jgi:small subunit ribosomal protein S16
MLPKEHADRFVVDVERVKYWLSKGAQPTERLEKMLSALGLVNAPATREQPKKSAPKAKALERIKEKEEKAAAAAAAAAEAAAQAEAPAEEASAE